MKLWARGDSWQIHAHGKYIHIHKCLLQTVVSQNRIYVSSAVSGWSQVKTSQILLKRQFTIKVLWHLICRAGPDHTLLEFVTVAKQVLGDSGEKKTVLYKKPSAVDRLGRKRERETVRKNRCPTATKNLTSIQQSEGETEKYYKKQVKSKTGAGWREKIIWEEEGAEM